MCQEVSHFCYSYKSETPSCSGRLLVSPIGYTPAGLRTLAQAATCAWNIIPHFCLGDAHTTFGHQLRSQPCGSFSLTHSPRTGLGALVRFAHSPLGLPGLSTAAVSLCVFICVFIFFWLFLTVCGILVLQPGIEPESSAVETWLSQPRDCLKLPLLLTVYFFFLLHCNFHGGKSGCFSCFVIV